MSKYEMSEEEFQKYSDDFQKDLQVKIDIANEWLNTNCPKHVLDFLNESNAYMNTCIKRLQHKMQLEYINPKHWVTIIETYQGVIDEVYQCTEYQSKYKELEWLEKHDVKNDDERDHLSENGTEFRIFEMVLNEGSDGNDDNV